MIFVTDSETGAVIIDVAGDMGENPSAIGTYVGPGSVSGPVYHGVKAWIAPRTRTHDWEPEGDAVFIQWVDKSSSSAGISNEKLHTVERPLPGGGVYRFLVTAER